MLRVHFSHDSKHDDVRLVRLGPFLAREQTVLHVEAVLRLHGLEDPFALAISSRLVERRSLLACVLGEITIEYYTEPARLPVSTAWTMETLRVT